MSTSNEYGFLDLLINDEFLHGKFLNTFSLLEYTGARKILKSQHEGSIDLEVLNHMAEEIRHAQLFKRYAHKVYPERSWKFNEEDVFCYEVTRTLLSKLDRFCEKLVGKSSCYHIVSYVIEKRALSFYKYYMKLLKENEIDISLRGLLLEEERHLKEMAGHIENNYSKELIDIITNFEKTNFLEFSHSISVEIVEEMNIRSLSSIATFKGIGH